MTIQKKLYKSTERKLVLWCIGAMLLMSASLAASAYFAVTTWIESSPHQQIEPNHLSLALTLLGVQAVVVLIGALLSVVFARKVLQPIRRAHQAQADFAANAHHQLRTPIAVMQAEIDTALLRGSQDKRTLESINEEVQLLRITSQRLLLLADGSFEDGQTIHPTSADIGEVLPRIKKHYPVKIKLRITPNVRTSLSQEELAIIFEALLDNTVKHAGIPKQDIVVTITLQPGKNGIHLIYADNGKGIAPGEEKRLFKRNFRGKRAKADGSGLGLAIVAEIIRAHSGRLKAGNAPDGGFQFVASIPKDGRSA